jgi:hypothetical protein
VFEHLHADDRVVGADVFAAVEGGDVDEGQARAAGKPPPAVLYLCVVEFGADRCRGPVGRGLQKREESGVPAAIVEDAAPRKASSETEADFETAAVAPGN